MPKTKRRSVHSYKSLKRLLFASLLLVFALSLRAQNTTVTFSAREMTVRQAISEMEKKTGTFFGFSTQLDLSRKIRLDSLEVPVKNVIEIIAGSEFIAEANGNYILIYDKALATTGFISGRFLHAKSGRPIPEGIVILADSIQLKTDRSGYFETERIPIGAYIARFTSSNYQTVFRELETTEKADFQTIVRLEPTEQEMIVPQKQPERLLAIETAEPSFVEYMQAQVVQPGKPVPAELPGYRLFTPSGTNYRKGYPRLAVKTNAIWWGIGTINAAAEIRLYSRWTADLSVLVRPWQSSGEKDSRFWLIQPEARYWFCEAFEKHFVGIHGIYANYQLGNLDLGFFPILKDNYLDGNAWGGGITYGYHLPLGTRWGLEFSAGVGFLRMKYDKHSGGAEGNVRPDNRYYIGPTKLGVSFFYMIR